MQPPVSWSGVRAVLFDLNGTLVDDVPRATRATNVALAGTAVLTELEFRRRFRLPLSAFFEALGGGSVPAWNAAMGSEPAPVMPGATDVLKALRHKGIRTAVVSAAGRVPVHADLDHHGLTPLLDEVFTDVADKAVVLASEAGPVLYVGDTEYDVQAAQQAGAWSVATTAGYRSRAELEAVRPWRLVDHLEEVLNLLPDG